MKKLTFVFMFIVLTVIAFGQTDWQLLNPLPTLNPLGGDYFISAQEGWVVGDKGIIMHTTDGGSSWNFQHENSSESFSSVFFIDDTEGWTVGWSSIYHTTDAGETWQKQIKPSWPGDLTDVFFINHDTGWIVGHYKIIFKTTDGGDHWQRIISDTHQEKCFFSVAFTDELHGCAVGGELAGNNNGIIMISNDGGNSWIDKTPSGGNRFNKVYFINADTGWVCGNDGVLFKTIDGGNTWVDRHFSTTEYYNDIHFFNDQQGVLLMGNQVRLTEDGGDSWDSLVYMDNSNWMFSFASGADNQLVAVGNTGCIEKSVDGGSTWNKLNSGSSYYFNTIGFFNSSDGLAIAGSNANAYLIQSSDGGSSWAPDTLVENGPFYKMQIDGNNCFLLNNSSQMMKSIDGGNSWELNQVPSITSYYKDMQFVNEFSGYLCSDSSILLKTTDGGITWEEISFHEYYNFTSMFFLNENLGWVIDASGRKLLRTKTGGNDWFFTSFIEDGYAYKLTDVFFVNEDVGYVSTYEGAIFKTIDGGDTWNKFFVFSYGGNSKIYFVSDEEGWCIAGLNIYHTVDGGETWFNRQSFGNSGINNLFFFDNGQGWICGMSGLVAWHSSYVSIDEVEDNESTMQVMPNPAVNNVTVVLDNKLERIYGVKVFNMMGQQVIDLDNINETGSVELDLSFLRSGTYIINVSSSGGNRLAKVVVR